MVIVYIFQNLSLLPHNLYHLDNNTVLERCKDNVESRGKGVQWLESARHRKESTIERL